jgi:CubicO group peptidase (beta-lactamase class C family)
MIRPLRLVAGWSVALATALLLTLALPRPTTAPGGAALPRDSASPNPSKHVVASPSPSDPNDGVPQVDPPSGETGSGSGRPTELIALSGDQAAALQKATNRARRAFGLDALAIGISIDGATGWTGASGLARDGITRLDGSSPFAIASITKTFTATLVLQLVAERRLSLHDEVAQLLPGVAVPVGVRVGHLLRHTSGIADLLTPLRDRMNADTERIWQPSEVVASVGAPWFAPGGAWAYSNTNYVLLGMIVERVTERPFGELLHERLLRPLELSGSGVLLEEGAPYLMAPSWASAFGVSGNMYANAHDLLRWGDALYGGQVLGPAGLGNMLDFGRGGYGMGAERIPVGHLEGYGHSGLLRGFTSLLIRLPDQGLTLVVMGTTNRFDPAHVLAHRDPGKASILDLARRAAMRQVAA